MKNTILLLLCCGLIMCSACNKAEPLPKEKTIITVFETKITESETDISSTINKSITTEKEKSTPVENKHVETSSDVVIKDEPK